MVPIFFLACVAPRSTQRWVDPNFAQGGIPIGNLEILPLSLAVNIDGVGASGLKDLRNAHETIARLVEKELSQRLTSKGYKLYQGYMSRERLFHLVRQVKDLGVESRQGTVSLKVDPALIAGGSPKADAVLVVDGFANITTGGKKAAQTTVVVLIVVFIIVVILGALIAAAAASKASKAKKAKKARKNRRKSSRTSRARRSRSRRVYRRRTARQSRRYRTSRQRRYYRRHYRRHYRNGPRYYEGSYRYRGRLIRYRTLRRRRLIRRSAFVFYYAPHFTSTSTDAPNLPEEHKQPFFSNSFLDLNVSIVEKGTGLLLWHHSKRWAIDPSNPSKIKDIASDVLQTLPSAHPDAFKKLPPPPTGFIPPEIPKDAQGPPGPEPKPAPAPEPKPGSEPKPAPAPEPKPAPAPEPKPAPAPEPKPSDAP